MMNVHASADRAAATPPRAHTREDVETFHVSPSRCRNRFRRRLLPIEDLKFILFEPSNARRPVNPALIKRPPR